MKYNINNLYFAKCRHCIMDIFMSYYEKGKAIVPRPDYVDYYTILLFKNGKYVDVFDKNKKYKDVSQVKNNQEYYVADLILEINPLLDYVSGKYKNINDKECELVETTIIKTKKLKLEFGYKNR